MITPEQIAEDSSESQATMGGYWQQKARDYISECQRLNAQVVSLQSQAEGWEAYADRLRCPKCSHERGPIATPVSFAGQTPIWTCLCDCHADIAALKAERDSARADQKVAEDAARLEEAEKDAALAKVVELATQLTAVQLCRDDADRRAEAAEKLLRTARWYHDDEDCVEPDEVAQQHEVGDVFSLEGSRPTGTHYFLVKEDSTDEITEAEYEKRIKESGNG